MKRKFFAAPAAVLFALGVSAASAADKIEVTIDTSVVDVGQVNDMIAKGQDKVDVDLTNVTSLIDLEGADVNSAVLDGATNKVKQTNDLVAKASDKDGVVDATMSNLGSGAVVDLLGSDITLNVTEVMKDSTQKNTGLGVANKVLMSQTNIAGFAGVKINTVP